MTAILLTLEIDQQVRRKVQNRNEVRLEDISTPAVRAKMLLTPDDDPEIPASGYTVLNIEMPLRIPIDKPPTEMYEWLRTALIRMLQTPDEKQRPKAP